MIFRLRDYIFSPLAIKREHDMLLRSQWWSDDERRAWVQERLSHVLDHAVRTVPYYRRTLAPYRSQFDDMVDRLDLSELPVLTKEHVRQHYDELTSDEHEQLVTSTTETSGSTGTPTRFLVDRRSNVHQFASIWRVLNWAGYSFGRPYADMTGYLPRNDGLAAYDWRTNCLHLSTFNFKKAHMPYYVRRLRRLRPVFIKAYPSAIDLFCRWLRELGIDDYRPRAVITCAESLLDHQRETVEAVLRCRVYDFYNQNERGALVSTCEHGTYHVHEEYALTEVVPVEGQAERVSNTDEHTGTTGQTGGSPPLLPEGAIGEVIATNLHNLAMPLIRYRTDDLAEVGPAAQCACGRSYRRLNRIIGRIEDVIVTPDGRHVGRLDAAFKYSPGIRMSQVVQQRVEQIEVRLVRADDFAASDVDRLETELRARLGDEIQIGYVYVDDIPPGRNGKVKFVVSEIEATAE
jgi:phenylacetate-CoA ligase